MFDMTGGKSTNAAAFSPAKLSCPKTPPAVVADKRMISDHRRSSPSPLRYGIGILSWCFVMLPGACWCGFGGLRYTASDFQCTTESI